MYHKRKILQEGISTIQLNIKNIQINIIIKKWKFKNKLDSKFYKEKLGVEIKQPQLKN